MVQARYKHIFLPAPPRSIPYSKPPRPFEIPYPMKEDRIAHATMLRDKFDKAWEAAIEKKPLAIAERNGVYLDFISEPCFDLALKSMENLKSGIRLLNVRTKGEVDKQQTIATVYIPKKKRAYFLNKIRDYAEKETRGKEPKPQNANLISRISDIHSALLTSFFLEEEVPLMPEQNTCPVEVWLRNDYNEEKDIIGDFDSLLSVLDIKTDVGVLKFPERYVKLIHANGEQLGKLIGLSDQIAEYRLVYPTPFPILSLQNQEQTRLSEQIIHRLSNDPESNVVVCILDTGINNGHPLIKPFLNNDDLHTIKTSWGTHDHDRHGTLMAGIAVYGDLFDVLNSKNTIRVSHRLESAKIKGPEDNPKEFWGYYTAQGLSLAEIQAPTRKRIVCMALTCSKDRYRGKPSSWSAKIDSLASGDDGSQQRLFIISAGNTDGDHWLEYPDSNLTDSIHDPAQSWNALTVGAYTTKITISDPFYRLFEPLAPSGGLSPHSTTSSTWNRKWPIKPEVVLEGGNVIKGQNDSVINADDVQLISTHYKPQEGQFAAFGETSAASAFAARMAAQIQTEYPNAWPETIRALIVHSSEWTDVMIQQFLPSELKGDYARLLHVCGYGVPNQSKAFYCASNSLTLISQAEIQPFDKKNNRYVTRDMHLYSLPWPTQILSQLGETQVEMRVTLSYFVEPAPGEIGWENRYKYASHGLRFDMNSPEESEDEFIKRINFLERDETGSAGTKELKSGTKGPKWVIGEARNVGSIHSDKWHGTAAALAASNKIAIYPTIGWWRERPYLGCWAKKSRYSLIISIYTPSTSADIYNAVATQIRTIVPIEIRTDKKS